MSKPAPTEPKAPAIPGVDFLAEPEAGARAFAGPFYQDQLEMLAEVARSARDRAKPGRLFIAPEGDGFTIYRRALKP